MKKNVLLLSGDGTQTLPVAESLYKNSYTLHMFYEKKLSYGFPTRYVKHKICIPFSYEEDKYLSFIKSYLTKTKIDVIIPLSDKLASLLSKHKYELLSYSKFIIPDYDIFIKGYNKSLLMRVCKENNFPHPKTIEIESQDKFVLGKFIFPAMLKPNYTTGGRGMNKVDTSANLYSILTNTIKKYGECHLQEFIQEGGKQFKVQLFVNEKCELIQSSVIYKQRYYPEKAGSSCCNITIKNDELVNICHSALKTIHWIGFADFDLIEDPKDGIIKIMELNPRIPACIKSAIKSGIDYGTIIADESLGNPHKEYIYTPGKKLRHIGFECLWFFCSKNRFKTKPNWFNFFDKNLFFQDFSRRDPLPFFYGTIGNIKQQFNSEFRKSKSGIKK
jgi:predicted ATP-grasp superfamily ATP-dependent carboligase